MADIHIVRNHALGLAAARKLALRWAEVAGQKLEMQCAYEEGKAADVVRFRRPGARGTLKVSKDRFELDASLGALLGLFRNRIETEIVTNLDELLRHKQPLEAFEKGLAEHEARQAAKKARDGARAARPAGARKAR